MPILNHMHHIKHYFEVQGLKITGKKKDVRIQILKNAQKDARSRLFVKVNSQARKIVFLSQTKAKKATQWMQGKGGANSKGIKQGAYGALLRPFCCASVLSFLLLSPVSRGVVVVSFSTSTDLSLPWKKSLPSFSLLQCRALVNATRHSASPMLAGYTLMQYNRSSPLV